MDCRRKVVTIRSTVGCLVAAAATEHDPYLLRNGDERALMQRVVPLKLY